MACLYRHIRKDNGTVFYVGIGKKVDRAYSLKARNKHWRSLTKITPYEVEIILNDISWEVALEKEVEFIKHYGRRDLRTGTLVNLTDGGEGTLGTKISEASRAVWREKMKGKPSPMKGKKLSNERINELKQLHTGNSYNTGKKRSETAKQRMSLSAIKRGYSQSSITAMQNANLGNTYRLGTKQSEETIEKRRLKAMGNKSRTGQKASEATKEKMRLAQHLRRLKEKI